MVKKVVNIEHDPYCNNPLVENDGMWSLESFTRENTGSLANPVSKWSYLTDNEHVQLWLRNKLRAGLAWWLSFTNYGLNAEWRIIDNESSWLSNRSAHPGGILIWRHPPNDMGAKSVEERRKDAESTLDTYNAWLAGNCFGFTVFSVSHERSSADDMQSCWGFIVTDNDRDGGMSESINDFLSPHDRVKIDDAIGVVRLTLKAPVLDGKEWESYSDPEPEYAI